MQVVKQFFSQSTSYFKGWCWQASRHFFDDWHMGERLWLVGATIVILTIAIIEKNSLLILIAALTGIWNDIFIAKGKIINFIFGVINNILYAYASFKSHVYGQGFLFLIYFLPMQFYSWFLWTKPENQHNTDVITRTLNGTQRLYLAIIIIVVTLIYGYILHRFGEPVAWTDALSTIISIIAMWLMARLFVEQWVCWIIINVVSVILWLKVVMAQGNNDITLLVMWLVFLINAIYGYIHWLKLHRYYIERRNNHAKIK